MKPAQTDRTRRGRRATPEEQDLWAVVMRDVHPLKRRSKPAAKPPKAPPPQAPHADKSIKPVAIPRHSPVSRAGPAQPLRNPAPSGIDGATAKRLSKGQIGPDAVLDLHGMTQNAAHAALDRFLAQSLARSLRCVLVITGKGAAARAVEAHQPSWARGGSGVLKTLAPMWLEHGPWAAQIAAIKRAHIRHGGDGALYIYLRKSRSGGG